MPQTQRIVPLILASGEQKEAIATGNNAAWMCVCGRPLPLLGKSGQFKGPSANLAVECPKCSRRYFVLPDGKDYGSVRGVRELVTHAGSQPVTALAVGARFA